MSVTDDQASTVPRRETEHRRPQITVMAALRDPRLLRTEVFAGLVTALALIPETISFSIIAGVGPAVGLFTSFIFAMTIAVVGGRPAMVSAAAGSVALVVAPVVRDHGVDYLIVTVIAAGVLQILLAFAGVAKMMRFIPQSVMTGFVNALAILIFSAQIPHLVGVPWLVYPMVAAGLALMILLPRITTVIPAPLIATALLTGAAVVFSLSVPRVADEGDVSSGLPIPGLPNVPMNWETVRIIAPYALAVALVGLLESLITERIVDEITETPSNPRRESWGQGVSNIVVGFFGGMGGCAMIGQTIMNVKTCGARTRISTFVAGVALLCMLAFFSPVLAAIPMAALVAVMIMVSVATMDWRSIAPSTLRRMPIGESATMLITVVVTVVTHNLALGVIAGVVCACAIFVRRQSTSAAVSDHEHHDDPDDADQSRCVHRLTGSLFFASSSVLVERFDYACAATDVELDLSQAHIWDATSVAALDGVCERFRRNGKRVRLTGLNDSSAILHARLSAPDSAN